MSIDKIFLDARIVMTVVSMASFLGITYWAYSAARKQEFDDAAQLPFADEPTVDADPAKESGHG